VAHLLQAAIAAEALNDTIATRYLLRHSHVDRLRAIPSNTAGSLGVQRRRTRRGPARDVRRAGDSASRSPPSLGSSRPTTSTVSPRASWLAGARPGWLCDERLRREGTRSAAPTLTRINSRPCQLTTGFPWDPAVLASAGTTRRPLGAAGGRLSRTTCVRLVRQDGAVRGTSVRAGTPRDMRSVAKLYEAVGFNPPGGIRRRDIFLLAYEGRRLLGALMYWVYEPDDPAPDGAVHRGARWLKVQEIAVFPERQCRGVGRRLMAEVAQAAVITSARYLVCSPSIRGGQLERRVKFFSTCGMQLAEHETTWPEMYALPQTVLSATATHTY
jgi:GNAT superfamily N-acetyltransferase